MFDGDYRSGEPWKFVEEGTTGIRIEKRDRTEVTNYFETGGDLDLKVADHKVKMYIDVLKLTDDESNNSISVQYLRMIKSWMLKDEEAGEVLLRPSSERPPRNVDEIIRMHRTPQQKVVDTKILQTMTDEASNKLVSDSAGAVDLITSVLSRDTKVKTAKFDDQDDTTALVLSLLNMVLTNPSFMVATIAPDMLSSLKNSLQIMAKSDAEVSSTARNLLMLLEFKLMNPNADAEEASLPSSAQDKIAEDRKTYKLALDYLTSPTNPTPVRAQGLDLLTSLISTNSPVLDVPATIILLSSLLQDGEEYIYLRTIKAFIALSNKNSKTVSNSLLDRYFDAEEDLQLDARLRLGEALTQVIEKSGQLFTGDMARHVCEGLLALAGRRGYRPKTEKEKAKRLRKEELDKKRAEREWGGAVPLLDDIAEDEEEDPEVTQVLNQIVTGWEGKRGEEDVRIRASALSIFGVAVETNIMGIGAATVAGGVDLSINILPLEAEPEKAILRRAAVLTVLSVLRAHEKAKEKGKTLGFGFDQGVKDIERVIGYVKDTDNDGLVRQHAKDVLEELESWKLQPLGAQQQSGGVITELGGLRGLNIGSQTASGAGSGMKSRPKIEEIE